MKYEYSENVLVQDSAAALMHDELGWDVVFAYNQEVLGENGTLGRKDYHEIILWRYFNQALKKLNPWITDAQITEARQTLSSYLSSASLLQINEEKYFMIRDGIPVTVKKPNGKTEEKKAIVIDFNDPDNNHFLAVKELKIHGDLYRRRTDSRPVETRCAAGIHLRHGHAAAQIRGESRREGACALYCTADRT